jgi:DNA-binding MarR family transcriptional regulator
MTEASSRRAASELAVLSARLMRIVQRFSERHEDELQLSLPSYRALHVLARRSPLRMSKLTNALMLSKQTVDALVVDGLASRGEDSNDRRHIVVEATGKGIARLQHYESTFQEYLNGLMVNVDEDEAASIASSLSRLNREINIKRDSGCFHSRAQPIDA